jgi:hypothetical protein
MAPFFTPLFYNADSYPEPQPPFPRVAEGVDLYPWILIPSSPSEFIFMKNKDLPLLRNLILNYLRASPSPHAGSCPDEFDLGWGQVAFDARLYLLKVANNVPCSPDANQRIGYRPAIYLKMAN